MCVRLNPQQRFSTPDRKRLRPGHVKAMLSKAAPEPPYLYLLPTLQKVGKKKLGKKMESRWNCPTVFFTQLSAHTQDG